MKVVKKSAADGLVNLEVTASTAEVSEVLNQAGVAFCNQMNLRPEQGKTPAQVASERLGIRDLDSTVAETAIEMLIPQALNKHGITPAFIPVPRPLCRLQRGHSFQFALDVMPKPAFELESYGPVSITVPPFESDESQVDAQINEIARHAVTFVADDPRPIGAGDSCFLKMEVTKDGEPVKSLTTEGRTITLGKGFMPPSFEEGLRGMEVGQTRSFSFDGPGLDADGNEVTESFEATVTLLEVQKEAIPVIDDAWVSKNMPMYKGLEDLKESIRKNVNAEALRRYEDGMRNAAAAELAKGFKGSIPDDVYEGMMHELQQRLRQQVQKQGQSWDQFVEQQGGEQQLGMMLMMQARQELVRGYALDAYYRHHGLSFTEEDLDEVCFTMNPRNPKLTRSRMEKSGFGYALRESAERLRACKHLVEHAAVSEKKPE